MSNMNKIYAVCTKLFVHDKQKLIDTRDNVDYNVRRGGGDINGTRYLVFGGDRGEKIKRRLP